MRRDMPKVIVERPRRVLGWGATRGRPSLDTEDLPHREGMRRPYRDGYGAKELTDHLGPLYRFLRKQVGRPWNKVYGEIREHVRADSTVQRHLLRHVEDFVSVHVARGPDGRLWDRSGTHGRYARCFYVDPRTGILRANKPGAP